MKGKRKFCALLMSCAMLFSLMPTTAFAVDEDDTEEAVQETEVQAADIKIAEDGTATIVVEEDAENDTEEAEPAEVEAEPVQQEEASVEEAEEDAEEEAEPEEYVYTANSDSIKVEVTAPAGALPEDAELSVERYAEDSDEYKEAADAIGYEEEDGGMAALDISFISDGQEVEPSEAVKVSIDVSQILPSDADASTLEVQHIEESAFGLIKNATVVANDSDETKGTIDEEKATAEFEVDSFSDFTVTWEWTEQTGTTSSVSLTVTAYLDDQELDNLPDIEFDSQDDELNLETMLNEEDFGTSDYIFSWAYVSYQRTQGPTTQTTTIGSEDDPVEAIEKTSGGQSSFIIIQSSGTSTTVQASYGLHLYAYYITPTFSVEITPVAEDAEEDWLLQATLSHAGDYTSIAYEWSVTDTDGNETSLAHVQWDDETGRAFIVWDTDNVKNFDEVVVHVKVTLNGDESRTAEASYTLEYGDEYVNLQMTYGPDNTPLGSGVTVTLTNTVTGVVYTGTTDSNGQILGLEIEPGIYVVEASTTIGNSNYSCSETVSMHDASENYTINLNYADAEKTSAALDSSKTDWNHVDIKLATGTTGSGVSSEGVTVNIIGVVITGSDDTVKYTANETSIAAGASDNEWQVYFYTGNNTSGSYSHTINFATTDSITITYTLQWEDSDEVDTYTVTIDASSTYASGTTYPANGQRAYKLYNYLYGTNYSSNAQLMAAGVDSIDISGMSMMLVAAILCDSSSVSGAGSVTGTAGMWGMDFALSVEGFASLSTTWMIDIEKTYVNHAMDAGDFTFYLYDADYNDSTGLWSIEEDSWYYQMSNDTAGMGLDGNSSYTFSGVFVTYDDKTVEENRSHYYIICEDQGDLENTIYDGTVFGVEVYVGIDTLTGEPVVKATYYTLTLNNDGVTYTATPYTGDKITTDEDDYSTIHFSNAYQEAVEVTFGGAKTISGTDSTEQTFEFALYETGGDFTINEGAEAIDTKTTTGAGSFAFDSISYDNEGTYYYVVKETSADGNGWKVDTTEYHITVVVTYTGDGTFDLTVTCVDAEGQTVTLEGTDANGVYSFTGLNFENTYDASGSLNLIATKEYTGAKLTENQFNFTITETTEGATYTGTGTNDADGNITFTPAIEYGLSDVGTHTYVIAETAGDAGGVTYDSNTITVTVVVADNGDGTLSTTVTVDGEELTAGTDGSYNVGTFENSYEATGSVTFGGEKTISGKDEETSQQFTFELYTTDSDFTVAENAEAADTQTVTGAGSFMFKTITYNEAGIYYYVVKETSADENGWTMDTNEYHITVVVTDEQGDGTFTIAVNCVDDKGEAGTLTEAENGSYSFTGLDFSNEYKASETSAQFTGSKYITNSEGTEEVFTFELYETDSSFEITGDSIDTQTTTGAGSITFDEITYDEAGTYYYVIQEKALSEGQEDGWTIDSKVYNITVVVEDDGKGQLVATVTVDGTAVTGTDDVYGGFDFSNGYAATGDVTLGVVKSISGVASTEKNFEFTLYESDESFAIGDSIEAITTKGEFTNSTQVNFTAIEYTQAGTYYYVIKETGTAPDGWTQDLGEYHVTVTATDDGVGDILTSASYVYVDADGEAQTEAGNAAAFTNTYAANGELALTGTKIFEGGDLSEVEFTFTMTDSTGASVGDATMDADGNITFPTITYDETDIGQEYTYTISEVGPDGRAAGVEYDDATYTVVVSIADKKDGTLNVTYTVNGEANGDITFTNYQRGSLTITKAFTGLTDEQIASLTDFTITVSGDDYEKELQLSDATKGDDGVYTWTVNNLPADTYTVTESGYSLDGYEVIAKSDDVTVTNGDDVSVNDELAWGGEDKVAFTNDYTEVGTITVSKYVTAEKNIQEAHEGTEYTIVITASEDANFTWVTITSDSGREITPTIDGKTITFTIMENETVTINGLPVGEYTVEEQGSDAATSEHCVPSYRVGNDETEEAPTVTVTSDSDNIVAIEIDNEYPVGTYIEVQKNYNKDEYPTGDDAFTFTIEALTADLEAGGTLDASEMPMPENSTVTITASDESHVALIQFNDPDNEFEHFGTYYYKITETKGSLDNVDYDESVHYVKVEVSFDEDTHEIITDEWEAKADAETDDYKDLEYSEAGIVRAEFTNTAYEELTLEKEVSGDAGDTTEYEFEITLVAKDGESSDGNSAEPDDSNANFLSGIVDWFSGLVKTLTGDDAEKITFTDGVATVTVKAGESVTVLIPSGYDYIITEKTTGADTTTVYRDGEVVIQSKGTTTEATADIGTVADSTQVTFVNSYRKYFPIDEEIVTDEDDIFNESGESYVKKEAVNEYNAIEIEMTTNLPVITAYDLENGEFTMNFHEVLDAELVLDEDTADFSVYIGEQEISTAYYRITFDEEIGDECNFHVDVDLTKLFNEGVVTEDMLDGDTEITIFFFADLEGTGLNGSYKSTIWYDIYDGDEWLYTSDESVVEVYTYEIEIQKYDVSTLDGNDYAGAALAGATLGIYYDEACTDPVIRNGEHYTEISGEDGMIIFYGLADGTYYVKELEAPENYVLSDVVLAVELGEDLDDSGYAYEAEFANAPEAKKVVDVDGDGEFDDDGQTVNVGDTLTYEISYYSTSDAETRITITDTLDYGLDFVSASDGGVYDEASHTVTWTIDDAAPQASGTVTLTVVVNETALVENKVENTATIRIGDTVLETNETDNPLPEQPGETRDISGIKTWDDDNDKADARPDSITVNLYQNGELYKVETVTAADGWAWSWVGLPACDEDGNAYVYTINENEVKYYTPSYESGNFNITNTFVGEEGAKTTSGPDQGGDNPKTGDTTNFGIWLALLVAAMACMLVGFRMRKRN